MIKLTITLLFFTLVSALDINAQVDASTLLSLRFENSLNGESGETPVSSTATTFQPGVSGQSVNFPTGSQVSYQSASNINAKEGTVEFWIKPNWNGDVNPPRTVVNWSGTNFGGMTIDIAFGDLSLIMNKFVANKAVHLDVRGWRAGEWHYVAVTYSNTTKIQQIYVDGVLRKQNVFTGELPAIANPNFKVGISEFYPDTPLDAHLDEFRISNRVRTGEEITARYLGYVNQLTVTNLSMSTITRKLWPTWKIPIVVTAGTNLGPIVVASNIIPWSSTNENVAAVNPLGEIVALSPGSTTLSTTVAGQTSSISLSVFSPPLPVKVEIQTGPTAMLPNNSLYEVPVVVVRYVPTSDGVNLDTSWAPSYYSLWPITLADLEADLDRQDEMLKFMLDESSRFRGYGSQAPIASIGRRIVATITVYEPPPPGGAYRTINNLPIYNNDHFEIFERLNLRSYVEDQGVKQVWLSTTELLPDFPSYNPALHPPENMRGGWESNMASPTTSDVSNSDQDNTDLPIYNQTYVVNGRPTRGVGTNSTHADGHQLEYMYRYVNIRQDGSDNLFTPLFQGTLGRAGSIHNPPNTTVGYDYHNYNPVDSDIKDWKPDNSGVKIPYNAATVRDTPYNFPNSYLPAPRVDPHWYIFWKQSLPGYGNNIPYISSGSAARADNEDTAHFEVCVKSGPRFETVIESKRETSIEFVKARREASENAVSTPSAVNRMTNWWQFVGDWDRAIRSGVGLYEPANCSYSLSGTSQSFPSGGGSGIVTVTSTTGCKWFASNNGKWTPLTSGDIGNGSGQLNFTVQPNITTSPRTTKIIVAGQPFVVSQDALSRALFDYDGDRRADLSVRRPSDGIWHLLRATAGYTAMQYGIEGDRMAPADYDGDGKTDVAVFRPSNGTWYIYMSQSQTFQTFVWGEAGDLPVPTDRDADGRTDLVVYRESDNIWYTRFANGTFAQTHFGVAGDKPVVGDFDADGKGDIAVYRPSNNNWYIIKSSLGYFIQTWGEAGDVPITGDFDGDGATDQAVFRPSTGQWYLSQTTAGFSVMTWGENTDIPVAADYDGDGKTDVAVFRPSNGTWYIVNSTAGILVQQFGENGDIPTQSAFNY